MMKGFIECGNTFCFLVRGRFGRGTFNCGKLFWPKTALLEDTVLSAEFSRFGADEFSFGYRSVFYRALPRLGVEPESCVLADIERADFFSTLSEQPFT